MPEHALWQALALDLADLTPVPERFKLSVGLQQCGSLAQPYTHAIRDDEHFFRISSQDLAAFSRLVGAVGESEAALRFHFSIDTSWCWGEYDFPELPARVHMPTPVYVLTASVCAKPLKAQPGRSWRDMAGSELLDRFSVSEDPRTTIDGFSWLRYVREQHGVVADIPISGSCDYVASGYAFKLYTKATADFTALAYGAQFGLPECAIQRSVEGRGGARHYLVEIAIPGAVAASTLIVAKT